MSIQTALRSVQGFLSRNSHVILTTTAVVGVIKTAHSAYSAGRIADTILEQTEQKWQDENKTFDPLPPKEAFLSVWKIFIPTAISGTITVAAVLLLNKVHLQKNAILVGSLALSDKAFNDFRDAVKDTVEEKVFNNIFEKSSEKQLKEQPAPKASSVIRTGNGEALCYDTMSGRYFYGSVEAIKAAQNNFNHQLINDVWGSLNDFYRHLGLEDIAIGDNLGWTTDRLMENYFSSHLTQDDVPCVSIQYTVPPQAYRV